MKTRGIDFAGKTAYGLIFMVAVPVLLWWWAVSLSPVVSLPAVQSASAGFALSVLGAAILLSGMYALWFFGKGLPMNAFPPPRYVQEGIFRYLSHPIYTGFVLICMGISVYTGSAPGFWVVTPVVAAGCAALAWGHENPDLKRRFPDVPRQFRFGVPPDEAAAPAWYHRVSIFVMALLPVWFFYSAIGWASGLNYQVEWPVAPPLPFLPANWGAATIAGAVVWVLAAPFVAKTRQQSRHFYLGSLAGGATLLYITMVIPSAAGVHWLAMRADDPGRFGAVFSISWFWIWLAAELYRKVFPRFRLLVYGISLLFTLGLVQNSFNPVLHFFAGLTSLLIALYYPLIWEFLRIRAEWVANSWQEWQFGPVRVINHGFYVGAAAFMGMLLAGALAGETYVLGTVVFGVIGVVSAGLWGQLVEGSDKLKRPFGYYGSLAGILIAVFVLHWMGLHVWVMLALFSVFMPWVQGIGRLRCLINGCCHGAPANERLGIRYFHPRSRVCFLSHLKGKALHPTQLYSLLWLTLVGGFQLRLWLGGATPAFIFAMYLILNGLGRFVEEAYRGEPQTPVFAGMRLYQWAATVSVLTGISLSTIPTAWPPLNPGLSWASVGWGLFMWGFVQFLMGVDFPNSTKRFSRLT